MAENGKKVRVELQPPVYVWMSWTVLICYTIVFLSGVGVSYSAFRDGFIDRSVMCPLQMFLCSVYMVEIGLAVGFGMCAMSPGWTCSELLQHHLPYVLATLLAISRGHEVRWLWPMRVSLLTALNEALFIVNCLGAPQVVNKVRRTFGFCIVTALLCSESRAYLEAMVSHWGQGRNFSWEAVLVDNLAWGGIFYHVMLLKFYYKRWCRTKEL
mmetsp:Transcript_12237/g.23761  ORF Transcript_12237/g.23761 Transcript_12237/m.23761 type:complete len:212 (+) Transcript_12237:50-685(+)